jgi:hypothetical protein
VRVGAFLYDVTTPPGASCCSSVALTVTVPPLARLRELPGQFLEETDCIS